MRVKCLFHAPQPRQKPSRCASSLVGWQCNLGRRAGHSKDNLVFGIAFRGTALAADWAEAWRDWCDTIHSFLRGIACNCSAVFQASSSGRQSRLNPNLRLGSEVFHRRGFCHKKVRRVSTKGVPIVPAICWPHNVETFLDRRKKRAVLL